MILRIATGEGPMQPGERSIQPVSQDTVPDVDAILMRHAYRAVAAIYKKLHYSISPEDIAIIATRLHNDVLVVGEDENEAVTVFKIILMQIRRAAEAETRANRSGKLSA